MSFTKDFKNLNKGDSDIAGGKGASLGEMTQAGIPVPDGFVVLSSTFDHFLRETDLIQEIEATLDKVDHEAIHTIDDASEKIRGLIDSKEIPKDIANEIKERFKSLKSEFVAVRSSATAEDGAEHAWAGQLESFLNTTEKNLLENVKKCWSSLFTPRAIFYRFEKGLHGTEISVAVVIQKMIQSEMSGIAFSVHPVTEDRNQVIIEAGFGLGEAIVSGSITPDSYVVGKNPRKIIDITINTQLKALIRSKEGGNEWKQIKNGDFAVLDEKKILQLTDLVIKIEDHYGFPCDIEWAYENKRFYITQSRPITTLSKVHKRPLYKKNVSREVNLATFEVWTESDINYLKDWIDVTTPRIVLENNNGIITAYEDEQILKDAEHNILSLLKKKNWLDNTIKLYKSRITEAKKLFKAFKISPSREKLKELFEQLARTQGGLAIAYFVPTLNKADKNAKELALKEREATEHFFYDIDEWFTEAISILCPDYKNYTNVLSIYEIIENRLPSKDNLKERQKHFIFYDKKFQPPISLLDVENKLNIKIEQHHIVTENKLVFEKSITRDWPLFFVEMLHDGFTKEFRKQFEFGYSEVLFDCYSDHLDIYRAPQEHISMMRDFILDNLKKSKNFIKNCSEKLRKLFASFMEFTQEIEKKNLSKISSEELTQLLKKFITAHTELEPTFVINFWFPIQMENYAEKDKWNDAIEIASKTRADTEKVGPEGDKIARILAEEISARMFDSTKYARFISLDEAYNFLLNGMLVDKKEIEKRMEGFVYGSQGIKYLTLSEYAELEGHTIKRVVIEDKNTIKGNSAFKGLVRGKVRKVISKKDIDQVQDGEILVAPMTTPEYMPALKKAIAFITDEGGITSHAAIVARELQKPCIIGTKVATDILRDGMEVEVDADNGIIRIL